jgi:hypothetical protein
MNTYPAKKWRRWILLISSLVLTVLFSHSQAAMGQWGTSGTNIYNTNSGNVGIGTVEPADQSARVDVDG